MAGEDAADQPLALDREMHLVVAAVFGRAFPPDQAPPLEIPYYQGHVAAASEDALAQVALAHGAEVEQGLEHAELARRQVLALEAECEAVPETVARAGQLEVGAEGQTLGAVPAISARLGHGGFHGYLNIKLSSRVPDQPPSSGASRSLREVILARGSQASTYGSFASLRMTPAGAARDDGGLVGNPTQ